jgi:preprotein translocase subunit SecF
LALLALLLFGGQAIHSFTATMMFGVVLVGTYTSVFIAAPILIYLGVGRGTDALTGGGSVASSNPDAVPAKFTEPEQANRSAARRQKPKGRR